MIEVWSHVSGFKVGDQVITLRNHASLMLASTDPWDTPKIPGGVSYEDSTFLPLASVALHALRHAQLTLGETTVILGAGIIGQAAVLSAKMDGARQVIALDLADDCQVQVTWSGPWSMQAALPRQVGASLPLEQISISP